MAEPTMNTGPEYCKYCGREIENRGRPSMDGNHEIKWVHIPGGHSVCFPQQGGRSSLAEPFDPECQDCKHPVHEPGECSEQYAGDDCRCFVLPEDACVHPKGYHGECPCPPSCGCRQVELATDAGLRERIAEAVRTQVRLRLGPITSRMAQRGQPVKLSFEEADQIADAVLPLFAEQTTERERDRLAAGVPLVCSDERHDAKVRGLEAERDRLTRQRDQALAVAEVIEANGARWAADAVRGALEEEC
jgi:hypothetical protein